jgi:hypothetical protein
MGQWAAVLAGKGRDPADYSVRRAPIAPPRPASTVPLSSLLDDAPKRVPLRPLLPPKKPEVAVSSQQMAPLSKSQVSPNPAVEPSTKRQNTATYAEVASCSSASSTSGVSSVSAAGSSNLEYLTAMIGSIMDDKLNLLTKRMQSSIDEAVNVKIALAQSAKDSDDFIEYCHLPSPLPRLHIIDPKPEPMDFAENASNPVLPSVVNDDIYGEGAVGGLDVDVAASLATIDGLTDSSYSQEFTEDG